MLFSSFGLAKNKCANSYSAKNLAGLFRSANIEYLVHETNIDSLVSILKSKSLVSRKKLNQEGLKVKGHFIPEMNRNVVYMTAIHGNPYRDPYPFRHFVDDVAILVSTKILNRNSPLFVNEGWSMGKVGLNTFRIEDLNRNELTMLSEPNEIIFNQVNFFLSEIKIALYEKDIELVKKQLIEKVSSDVSWEKFFVILPD